ncbi:unnamed protein product [Natator depressus]
MALPLGVLEEAYWPGSARQLLDSTMRFSSLDISHADLMNMKWPYAGNEQSQEYLANLIHCIPCCYHLDTSSHPISWNVLSVVMNINRGNPAGHEVLVDTWPEFKAILTRPHRGVASDDTDFYTNTYAAFYRDLGANRALLGSAVNWGQAFCILGLQNGVYEASRDIAKAKAVQLEASRYFTYLHPDPSTMPEIRLDPSVRLSSLDVSHADLLNETWAFGGNDNSRRYLANLIRHFPGVCLLDAAGRPVSWIITDPFGIMTHGYTLPQHQGRGYIQVLLNVMAKQMHAWGYPSYGHVAVDN